MWVLYAGPTLQHLRILSGQTAGPSMRILARHGNAVGNMFMAPFTMIFNIASLGSFKAVSATANVLKKLPAKVAKPLVRACKGRYKDFGYA